MAHRAKAAMSGRYVRSLHCKIGYGKPIPSTCLYVSGLEPWINVDAVHRLFSRFGPVVHLDWSPRRNHAHVQFDSIEASTEANNQLKGLSVGRGTGKRLRADFLDPDIMRTPRTNAYGLSSNQNITNTLLEGRISNLDFRTSVGLQLGLNSSQLRSSAPDLSSILTTNKIYAPSHSTDNFNRIRSGPRGGQDKGDRLINRQAQNNVYKRPFARGAYHFNEKHDRRGPYEPIHLNLHNAHSLADLAICLQPDLWKGEAVLKNNRFPFRCLYVIGDAEMGTKLGKSFSVDQNDEANDDFRPTLPISHRASLSPTWMAEATHRVHNVLSSSPQDSKGLCLMLMLPYNCKLSKQTSDESVDGDCKNSSLRPSYPLQVLVAYLKLKQSAGVVASQQPRGALTTDDHSQSATKSDLIHLFAPSSFALSLLKQAAPQLGSELATADDYVILLTAQRIEP